MIRKTLLALVAISALGFGALAASTADARHCGRGGGYGYRGPVYGAYHRPYVSAYRGPIGYGGFYGPRYGSYYRGYGPGFGGYGGGWGYGPGISIGIGGFGW